MIDEVAPTMTRLPDLAPPASVAANVMARIARLPDRSSLVIPAETSAVTTESRRGERMPWAWALAGLVVAFGAYVRSEIGVPSFPPFTSSRIGHLQLVTMPLEPAMLILALGLLLYVKGLFSPLRRVAFKEPGAAD